MRLVSSILSLTLLLGVTSGSSNRSNNNNEFELTFEIEAGKEDCFFQPVKSGQILDVEYSVVDGGQRNDLSIDFRVHGPDGVPLFADYGKADNNHRSSAPFDRDGDVKICFDNARSRFSPKTVFFELVLEHSADNDYEDEFADFTFQPAENNFYDVKVEDIQETLRSIKERIGKSRHFQDQLRAMEFRDRSIAEHNFENVNFWSLVHMVVLVTAGLTQVILLRSLFDEKSSLHKVWKKVS